MQERKWIHRHGYHKSFCKLCLFIIHPRECLLTLRRKHLLTFTLFSHLICAVTVSYDSEVICKGRSHGWLCQSRHTLTSNHYSLGNEYKLKRSFGADMNLITSLHGIFPHFHFSICKTITLLLVTVTLQYKITWNKGHIIILYHITGVTSSKDSSKKNVAAIMMSVDCKQGLTLRSYIE